MFRIADTHVLLLLWSGIDHHQIVTVVPKQWIPIHLVLTEAGGRFPGIVRGARYHVHQTEVEEGLEQDVIVQVVQILLWHLLDSEPHLFLSDAAPGRSRHILTNDYYENFFHMHIVCYMLQ